MAAQGDELRKVVQLTPGEDAAAPRSPVPPADPSAPERRAEKPPYSGGAIETVGLEAAHAAQAAHPPPQERDRHGRNLDMERTIDGPRPDLSDFDKYDAYLQAQPLTTLVQDAFLLQKEHLLNRLSWTMFVASPAMVNAYRSWPLLRHIWVQIPFCENAFGPYADFVLALLLVFFSSALCSILFIRVLEMRDARYVLLIAILLGTSFLVQESMIVGWAQIGKMMGFEQLYNRQY